MKYVSIVSWGSQLCYFYIWAAYKFDLIVNFCPTKGQTETQRHNNFHKF